MKVLSFGCYAILSLSLCLWTGQASADLLQDGGFENNPNTAWSVFGNGFPDEAAPGIDALFEESESLKMFGNFSGGQNFTGAFQDVAVDGVNVKVGDLVQLSGFIAQLSTDSLSEPNVAFLELTWVDTDPGGLGEFGFGANKSADFTSANAADNWEFFITAGAFVPVEAEFVRAKAVFVQDSNAGGAAWVDNVSLVNLSAIPEPGAATALVMVGLTAFSRRRRS